MSACERLALWLRLTSLPPPEERGFEPKDEPEELTIRQRYACQRADAWKKSRPVEVDPNKVRGFMPKWAMPDPAWMYNSNPWQENAIRAWEDGER